MDYYVYILQSEKDNGYYIGITSNLKKRLFFHNQGLVKSTKYRRPLKIIHTEKFKSKPEALKREKFLKRQKGSDVFKKIISLG